MFLFNDGLREVECGRVQVFGGVMIADRRGDVIEWLKRPSWLEVLLDVLLDVRPCCECVLGGHHGLVRVTLPYLALGVRARHREKAGPVNVAGRIQVVAMKGLERWRPRLGMWTSPSLFANDRAVFAFDSGMIIPVPGTGCGQFDQQLVEHVDHVFIDRLGAVVGMKRQHDKRELVEEGLQHRNQISFAERV